MHLFKQECADALRKTTVFEPESANAICKNKISKNKFANDVFNTFLFILMLFQPPHYRKIESSACQICV